MNAPRTEAASNGSPAAPTVPVQGETVAEPAADRSATFLPPSDAQRNAGSAGDRPRPDLPKIIPFETLTRCGDEIWIENEGQIYRLRKTRQGKLILTK